ncbi:MAG: hypothetical protein EOO88_07200 [Pedobacter sp.]|nr:MAG: hypothetical protein EOO88_07200 [Pedobacter sp.]
MENNISSSPKLIINNLTLVGIRKNYSVSFHTGLNIIHGDSDTGKSSILNLIDYCLGASVLDRYDEINTAGRYCLLELSLNDKVYTVKRDIFDTKKMIDVYQSSIAEMDMIFPLQYGPNYQKQGEHGYISDFFLDALNIPRVEVKVAPSKMNSAMSRLSFRDILKYCYLNQDDTGSKGLLDHDNFSRAIRHQETFKFMHNLLDEAISQLNAYISERSNERSSLNSRYNTISSFLRETQLRTAEQLDAEKKELGEKIALINQDIEGINREMMTNTATHNQLRSRVDQIVREIFAKRRERDNMQLQMQQNILLKNEYQQDIDKLLTSKAVQAHLPREQQHVDCPVCSNPLKMEDIQTVFQESSSAYIDIEVKSIRGRFKDVSNLIDEYRNGIVIIRQEIFELSASLDEARVLLDNRTKETISPYLSQRDGFLTLKTRMLESIENIDQTLKIRNQLKQIASNVAKLEIELEQLGIRLEELQAKTPTPEEVTNNIADYLAEFLRFVRMNNVTRVSVDMRSFLPSVRNTDYWRLTSGGVRTLVSVGYFVSLLKNSIYHATNHPNFLMIDTIGKYLGKTKAGYLDQTNESDDRLEGITASDPTKYINMYRYILNLCKDREDVQIIIVDNDIPTAIETDFKSNVVREFDAQGKGGLLRGFIDDVPGLT